MTLFYEKPRSRARKTGAGGDSLRLDYFCAGATSEAEVYDLAFFHSPITLPPLVRQSISIDPIVASCFDVTVEYGVGDLSTALLPPDPAGGGGGGGGGSSAPGEEEPLGPGYSFEIGGETVTILQSLETIYALRAGDIPAGYPSGGTLTIVFGNVVNPAGWTVIAGDVGKRIRIIVDEEDPNVPAEAYKIVSVDVGGNQWTLDASLSVSGTRKWEMMGSAPWCNGAIGVNGDTVQGCEKILGTMHWSREVKRSSCTMRYTRAITELVGKWNRWNFYGRPPFTCQYLGANGGTGKGTGWDTILTHRFRDSKTENQIQIGAGVGRISVPQKLGMNYMWAGYANTAETRLTQAADSIYIERTDKTADFSILEIGQ